jgi:hypothetical protein
MAVRPRGKSWGYGSVRQLSKRHWSVQSEFVSNTLAGFRVLFHPSAEERLATHTPTRENDVDHFWAYWGTWSRFSADGREVASARCSALEVPRVIQDGGVERIWTGPLSTLVAPAALSTNNEEGPRGEEALQEGHTSPSPHWPNGTRMWALGPNTLRWPKIPGRSMLHQSPRK